MASYINHPLIKKDAIESRLYQQILAGDVLKKEILWLLHRQHWVKQL